ncbi:hypothetical protein [Enterobacter kobei]|uniref:hypothetical protein n=1 Tax=Enterobacter kobei TaxID=208224 RepID=UPI00075069D0|nr:hypothetical protein [Enterobacter kobei]KUQ78756.1 hypothetical protein AWI26_04720 [Enterobacter kobei]
MSTITKEFTKEQLQQIIETDHVQCGEASALARIALASLEAEPVVSHIGSKNALDAIVAFIKSNRNPTLKDHNEVSERLFQDNCHGLSNHVIEYIKKIGEELEELRSAQDSAPPASVSVPAACEHTEDFREYHEGWNACRAAMHQGAEPVSNRDELPDDFDFDRFNDVVWLEAVASNPHMHSPTTSTIAMVALELKKKLADGKPELTVWYGSMPESNGKANWTAILHRKGEGRCMDGFTIDRSEYPGRVLYAADRVRYLIGEKSERPSILDYDADAHSGYVKPGNSPVIPDGWVLVPIEPTEDMIVNGFESEPDEFFSDAELWEAYNAMTGCQQAAHRAKLCWAAMIAASQKS